MGARNRVGIKLSHRPVRLNRMAKLIPSNRFLGSLKVQKFGLWLLRALSRPLSEILGNTTGLKLEEERKFSPRSRNVGGGWGGGKVSRFPGVKLLTSLLIWSFLLQHIGKFNISFFKTLFRVSHSWRNSFLLAFFGIFPDLLRLNKPGYFFSHKFALDYPEFGRPSIVF